MADTDAGRATRRPSRVVRVLVRLDRTADRRWFLPSVAVFPMCDYVVPVLPNQMLLIVLSALHPRRSWMLAATFVAATGLGAFGVAAGVQTFGPSLLDLIVGGAPDDSAVRDVIDGIERYGLWLLVGFALLPWPPRTAVLACALVGLPPWAIGLAVLVGRPLPAAALAYLGAKAPHVLRRVPSVDRVLAEVAAHRRAR